jgi:hypothetical protein
VKTKTCPDCNGDGVIGKGTDDEQQCPTCGGSGFVPDDDDDEEVTRTASWGPDLADGRCPLWVKRRHEPQMAVSAATRLWGVAWTLLAPIRHKLFMSHSCR